MLEAGHFKPLKDELESEKAVNKLLIAGFMVPIVGSGLQAALAYIYFRFAHPWSSVLSRYVWSAEERGPTSRPTGAVQRPRRGQSNCATPQSQQNLRKVHSEGGGHAR